MTKNDHHLIPWIQDHNDKGTCQQDQTSSEWDITPLRSSPIHPQLHPMPPKATTILRKEHRDLNPHCRSNRWSVARCPISAKGNAKARLKENPVIHRRNLDIDQRRCIKGSERNPFHPKDMIGIIIAKILTLPIAIAYVLWDVLQTIGVA